MAGIDVADSQIPGLSIGEATNIAPYVLTGPLNAAMAPGAITPEGENQPITELPPYLAMAAFVCINETGCSEVLPSASLLSSSNLMPMSVRRLTNIITCSWNRFAPFSSRLHGE